MRKKAPSVKGVERVMNKYTLIRSNRKSIGIRITEEGGVEVRAPKAVPQQEIDKIVAAKGDWIAKNAQERAARYQNKCDFCLQYGATLRYRGRDCPLLAKEGNELGFDGAAFTVPTGLSEEERKKAVVQIYKMLAKRDLSAKVSDYAKRMNLWPKYVKVNSAKSRWGSCSVRGSLNFSWRLIMAPDAVIDYVVVHELAHIQEHNHSPRFWAVVERVFPDYPTRQEGLKRLQESLAREDWG